VVVTIGKHSGPGFGWFEIGLGVFVILLALLIAAQLGVF
jgi:hypothetical protein